MADFFTTFIIAMGSSLSVLFFIFLFYLIMLCFFIGLGLFVLWIITLIDCIKRDNKNFKFGGANAKLIWILLLVFFRNITPIIYYFIIMYKPKKLPK